MSNSISKKYEVYMEMARSIAKLSPDKNTKVGAIMLGSKGRIIASSFNGFLRGAPDDELPCEREDKCIYGHDKYVYMQHAERNMIYNCSNQGISTKNTTIICTLSPCLDCLRATFASGVKTIVFDELYSKFENIYIYANLPDVHVDISQEGGFTVLKMISKKKYDKIRSEILKIEEKMFEDS